MVNEIDLLITHYLVGHYRFDEDIVSVAKLQQRVIFTDASRLNLPPPAQSPRF
jgi:hypothetical protein